MANSLLNNAARISQSQVQFASDVKTVLTDLEQMLVAKNLKYGDAALNPRKTFSSASAAELINVRIDDKLSRIANRQNNEDEDPEWDLLGYLVLKRILITREKQKAPSAVSTKPSDAEPIL